METKTITVQRTKTIPFKFNLAMMISRGEKEGEIIFKGEEGEVGGSDHIVCIQHR